MLRCLLHCLIQIFKWHLKTESVRSHPGNSNHSRSFKRKVNPGTGCRGNWCEAKRACETNQILTTPGSLCDPIKAGGRWERLVLWEYRSQGCVGGLAPWLGPRGGTWDCREQSCLEGTGVMWDKASAEDVSGEILRLLPLLPSVTHQCLSTGQIFPEARGQGCSGNAVAYDTEQHRVSLGNVSESI